MKKIIILSHALELGGAENALLGLLESLDTTTYQVDLFLLRHQGELLPYIPAGVRLLPESPQYSCMAIPLLEVIKRGRLKVALFRAIGKWKARRRIKTLGYQDSDIELEYSHKYTCPVMPMLSEEAYDLAISFLTPHYYILEKVHAKKKIAWIHTDYSAVRVDRESQLQMWSGYDRIVSISDKVTESFLSVFPELEAKMEQIGNILPLRYIAEKADAFSAVEEMQEDGSIRLLSIGRFCAAKNFDTIPEICRHILASGLNVTWYLIGYGGDEALIREKIRESGMEDHVIILGKRANPYPYINRCDLYVQPSRYEGKCVSVIEAQVLHKPVVITNYATANSQLTDGFDGMIVPQDPAECAGQLAEIIRHMELRQTLSANTFRVDYSNAAQVQKLYRLL